MFIHAQIARCCTGITTRITQFRHRLCRGVENPDICEQHGQRAKFDADSATGTADRSGSVALTRSLRFPLTFIEVPHPCGFAAKGGPPSMRSHKRHGLPAGRRVLSIHPPTICIGGSRSSEVHLCGADAMECFSVRSSYLHLSSVFGCWSGVSKAAMVNSRRLTTVARSARRSDRLPRRSAVANSLGNDAYKGNVWPRDVYLRFSLH
jgi:hypothetical protein